MRGANVWMFIGLSVLNVALRIECTPVEEVKISHIVVEMGSDHFATEDLNTAASDHNEDTAELSHQNDVGYLKKSEEKGGDGYQHFESFHDKDGDSYGYEKHDAFGKDSKHGAAADDEKEYAEGGHGGKGGHYTHEEQNEGGHDDEAEDDEEEADTKPIAKVKGTAEHGPDKHSSYSYHYNSEDDKDKNKKKANHYTNDDGDEKKPSGHYSYAVEDDDDEESESEEKKPVNAYSYSAQHDGDEGHDDDGEAVEEDDESDGDGHNQSYSYADDEEEDKKEEGTEDSDYSPSQYKEDKSDGFSRFLSDNYKANEEDESNDDDDFHEVDDEEDEKASLKKGKKDDDDEEEEEEEDDEEGSGDGKPTDKKPANPHGHKAAAGVRHTTYHGKAPATSYAVHHDNSHKKHANYDDAAPHHGSNNDHGGGHANKVNSNSYESHVVHVVNKKKAPHGDDEEHHQSYTHQIAPKRKLKKVGAGQSYQVIEHQEEGAKGAKYQSVAPARKYRSGGGPEYSYGQQF